MSAAKKLNKNDVLFREGDASDAMYVIKSGRIAITKAKGNKEVVLAELGPGQMLGEMAFFDNKPRSAGARAATEAEVITLPFKALHLQFKGFPEWLKAMVKTINDNLRNANQKIKNLEVAQKDSEELFPPYTLNKLLSILVFVAHRYGETGEGNVILIPAGTLRKFTIQVFQEPTNKMQSLMQILETMGHMKVEDLGEGKQRISMLSKEMLFDFVEFHNDYLFTDESKRITIEENEIKIIKAVITFGKKVQPNEKGITRLNLTDMQNNSMRDLQYLVKAEDVDSLSKKNLMGERMQGDGFMQVDFTLKDLERILPFWEMIYTFRKAKK